MEDPFKYAAPLPKRPFADRAQNGQRPDSLIPKSVQIEPLIVLKST